MLFLANSSYLCNCREVPVYVLSPDLKSDSNLHDLLQLVLEIAEDIYSLDTISKSLIVNN